MSARDAELVISDMLNYAQRVERAVNRLRRQNVTENDISFDKPIVSGYNHASAQPDEHKVFHPSGGAMKWTTPQDKIFAGATGNWIITGANQVNDLGTDCASTTCNELLLVLTNIKEDLCIRLNNRLDVPNPSDAPPADSGNTLLTLFQGSFTSDHDIDLGAGNNGNPSACYFETDSSRYNFYYTLITR